ncbi:hypothetical protein POM88_000599 [Heracleum sosnowskyi]|uniref:ATP-grasp fold ATP-dependent carboxylate-amine ligase-type domain-containing protein n=1 Tax=Heracleum sosnowskyi TaxID=360622 RepID=A0AAD8JCJ8_9APIA|nr:hypothetical protein POM88_000599 [Heracleum sosnowskyi]
MCSSQKRDKDLQKLHFSQHGIQLSEYVQLYITESAKESADLFGYPIMIKKKKAGLPVGGFDCGLYAEKWALFELSIIIANGRDDSIWCNPVVETIRRQANRWKTCHFVIAPSNMPWKTMKLASDVACRAVSSLEGSGVFAVQQPDLAFLVLLSRIMSLGNILYIGG